MLEAAGGACADAWRDAGREVLRDEEAAEGGREEEAAAPACIVRVRVV